MADNEKNKEMIRGGIDWKRQTEDQMFAVRQAWNLGDLNMIKNTLDNLYNWLYPEIADSDRKDIEKLETEQKSLSAFYRNEDREYIRKYGSLTDARKEELEIMLSAYNKVLFKKKYTKMYRLLMDICKKKGIGAEIETEAVISWDKKKPITSA